MDKTIGVSDFRKSIASVLKDVKENGSRYIILQHSRAQAILLSPGEMEALEPNKEPTSYEKFFGK